MNNTRIFRKQSARDAFEGYANMIKKEIESSEDKYVLNIEKEKWLEYFIDKFEQVPLTIYPERISQFFVGKGRKQVSSFGEKLEVETIKIALSVPYEGTTFLLELRPSSYTLNSYGADISGYGSGLITRTIELTEQNEQVFNTEKRQFIEFLASNVSSVNKEAESFNQEITRTFTITYDIRKQKALSQNSFFEKLGLSINPDTQVIYQPPTLIKKRIPEPVLDSNTPKNYTPNPIFQDEHYQDILQIIYATFKAVEKKPSIYSVKNEEELRDYILPILETRYESATVTGETFNKGGKTDILVRYKDNTNLFVAECKYWKGEAGFSETINQLFDRYLTWRDSKTALIFFVENKEFSKVLLSIKEAVKKHSYFVRETGIRGESSFSYIFHFPTDKGKNVYTEIMAFHFPK